MPASSRTGSVADAGELRMALRYGLISRPAHKQPPKANQPSDFDCIAMMKIVHECRKRAQYIGNDEGWTGNPNKGRYW